MSARTNDSFGTECKYCGKNITMKAYWDAPKNKESWRPLDMDMNPHKCSRTKQPEVMPQPKQPAATPQQELPKPIATRAGFYDHVAEVREVDFSLVNDLLSHGWVLLKIVEVDYVLDSEGIKSFKRGVGYVVGGKVENITASK